MNNFKRFAIAQLLFAGAVAGLHGDVTPEQKQALLQLNRTEAERREAQEFEASSILLADGKTDENP